MEDNKNYISSVKLPDNDIIYYLKDLDVRKILESLFVEELIIDCGTADEYISD
jgi:hypothetical protein